MRVGLLIMTACVLPSGQPPRSAPRNPFFAMDTAFQRPGLSEDQQLELVRELGFAGIAATESTPEQAIRVAERAASRGLKLHAIYCQASVTPDGRLSHSPDLVPLMAALRGRGTIVWLHIGGTGPEFAALSGKEPLFATLRELADEAGKHDLRVALYPHVGEWTARFGDATTLAKRVNHPRLGVTFNLCHSLAMGDQARIPELIAEAKSVLLTATICGADAGVAGAQWERLIRPLGLGTYDPRIVVRALAKIDFTGPIGFQGFGIPGDARSILEPTMKAWRGIEGERGNAVPLDGRTQSPLEVNP